MSEVIIAPDRLREVAKEFRVASKDSRKIIKGLDGEMKSLQTKWRSASQQSFYRDYMEWNEHAAGFMLVLESIAREMEAIADRFEKVDRRLT